MNSKSTKPYVYCFAAGKHLGEHPQISMVSSEYEQGMGGSLGRRATTIMMKE